MGETYASQCFSIAFVESMIVPSMSNKKPSKEARTGGAENDMAGEENRDVWSSQLAADKDEDAEYNV